MRPLGIDVWEVVDAAETKPFGFMPFYPGPGLGGHCIPIDPFYLSWKARQSGFDARFIELAGHINGAMPHYVVDKVADALNTKRKAINGSKVLIAGVAYKRTSTTCASRPRSTSWACSTRAERRSSYIDPHVPEVHGREWSGRFDIKAVNVGRGSFGQYDCVVVITDHKSFDYDAMVAESDVIVDTGTPSRHRPGTSSSWAHPDPRAKQSQWGQRATDRQFTIHGLTQEPGGFGPDGVEAGVEPVIVVKEVELPLGLGGRPALDRRRIDGGVTASLEHQDRHVEPDAQRLVVLGVRKELVVDGKHPAVA